jgi:hypothetical protein
MLRRGIVVLAIIFSGCHNAYVSGAAGGQACVTATACGLYQGGASKCTANVAGVNVLFLSARAHVSGDQVNCLAQAGADCDAARRCLNGGQIPSVCTGNGASCTGNVLTNCTTAAGTGGQKGTTQFDCSTAGQMCIAQGNSIDCGVGTCAGNNTQCVGALLQTCEAGILHQLDCGIYGSTCVQGVIPHCRGTGVSCTGAGLADLTPPLRCEGNVLVSCYDSQEARFDCSAVGEGCYANAKGKAFACGAGSGCDPNTFSATCAGSKLTFCNDGLPTTYDCAGGGFKGCTPNNGGTCTN